MATLFVEELTNLDFAFLCPRRGLVGETYLLDLELRGELDVQGMVLDFGRVKREVRDAAEALVDHKLLVPAANPAITVAGGRVEMALDEGGAIEVTGPESALCVLDQAGIDMTGVGTALTQVIQRIVPNNVVQVRVALRTEQIEGASYHYCHGLRKHDGDCQRIAHGHRSRIRIERAGQRDPGLESAWAQRWSDRFLATGDDELSPVRPGHRRFGYDAPQGRFELELPQDRVDVLPGDTTVECLAGFIAQTLANQTGDPVTVRAYEGLRKGAIAAAG